MLAARPAFAFVTQLVVAAGLRLSRHPKPLQETGRWWMVSGTLIDLLCLGMLNWLNPARGHSPGGTAQCAARAPGPRSVTGPG